MAKDLQIVLALCFVCLVGHVVTDCNVCQTNQAACINSTSFYLCFGDGMPHTDRIYNCLEGTVCTARTAICVQKNAQWPPSCGDTSKCGQCSAHRNHKFACQSRGTFQMCYGATRPTGALGFCPPGYACDASSDVVCTPERVGQTFTCDLHDDLVSTSTTTPTTTVTTASPTTVSTTTESTALSPDAFCRASFKGIPIHAIPNDTVCTSYIYCRFYINTWVGRIIDCPAANPYFNGWTRCCGTVKATRPGCLQG
ncbi:PREDICTED: uncharacterized protein LOC108613271 [Drosophila arizonae]|uniref:Uncharacterized protein LOC108613271 n=1 Tax=Drosophila arizonae TaxID=7263 RepID=A0ABM1P4H9_DROAR|nr:PREDICTED: uncharacterized protein LOC108613271 [Drosophila arizonae]